MTPPAQRRWTAATAVAVLSVLLLLSPQLGRGEGTAPASSAPQAVAVLLAPGAVAERLHHADTRGQDRPALPWAALPSSGSAPTGVCVTAGATGRTACVVVSGTGAPPVRGPPAGALHL
jgi:hypothetical protein